MFLAGLQRCRCPVTARVCTIAFTAQNPIFLAVGTAIELECADVVRRCPRGKQVNKDRLFFVD